MTTKTAAPEVSPTPPPWFISTKFDSLWKSYGHKGTIIASDHLSDGTPYYQDAYIGDIQSEKDAAFIVRACNSHESLKAFLKAFIEYENAQESSPINLVMDAQKLLDKLNG